MSDAQGRTAVVVTAWRRPYYLERTLDAWSKVDGIRDVTWFAVALGWHLPTRATQFELIAEAERKMGRRIEVWEDSREAIASPGMHRALGEAAGRSFDKGAAFTVFGEEDVQPSADVLAYMDWCNGKFAGNSRVLLACAHNCGGQGWDELGIDDADADPSLVRLRPYFQPWIWGTWYDRWHRVLEPQWDWECSSGGANDSGYDWQITRIIPRGGFVAAVPDASRSQNIGRDEGVYAIAANFPATQSASYRENFGPVTYQLVP